MPEGNTVWLTARTLRATLAGQVLTHAEVRMADLATAELVGQRVVDVVPRGKHLLIRLEPATLTLHTHLRMDGRWRTHPAGYRVHDPDDHVRVVLANTSGTAVGWCVHDVALVPTSAEGTLVGHLGPDLLGPDWDADEANRRLLLDPDRAIGEALLDQRNLAGAGNVYKAEICFLRGISPWTPVGAVKDLAGVVHLAHRLLTANRERYDHVTTGDTRAGRRTWVYDRAGRPCRRCGAAVQLDSHGDDGRISYWCPRCQPGPVPARVAAAPRLRS
ncbi:MAG TPA: DNA-formamidopyrimidine glycosylase family protein [Acidothermaceae bacterium]|nr:DNA-formamidopyrimidine glycosylase family protein [Acidothermaceae bacterium]